MIDEEVIRFDIRSAQRFMVCGIGSEELAPLRAFFENFGLLSECKTSATSGVVYGFVAFHSQRVTDRVRQSVKYAVIDGRRARVVCVTREHRDRNRTLPVDKMIDIANFYFGVDGWSSSVLEAELCQDSLREVEFVGDEEQMDNTNVDTRAIKPNVVGVGVGGGGGVSRNAFQANFRATVRVEWCGDRVVTADAKRTFVQGHAERLVVQPTLELTFELGTKAAVSDALKDAFAQIALLVLYDEQNDDRAFELAVHFGDESVSSWNNNNKDDCLRGVGGAAGGDVGGRGTSKE
jgi:hypothetical protein